MDDGKYKEPSHQLPIDVLLVKPYFCTFPRLENAVFSTSLDLDLQLLRRFDARNAPLCFGDQCG